MPLLLLLLGCSPAPPPATETPEPPPAVTQEAPPPASTEPTASAPEPSAPAGTGASREQLEVPGFLPAEVVAPPGPGPFPLIVVTHGAGGRPEPHCDRYAELAASRAFIVCTRGVPNNRHLPEEQRGYFYDGHHQLAREVLAAMDAVAERYGNRVDTARALFAGYSQGASMGLLFLHLKAEYAARFSGALLVEGGFADWNVALSERMKAAGLTKVAIVCGRVTCLRSAEQSVRWMKQGGLDAKLLYAPRAGHTYGATVAPLVEEAFDWLSTGDTRYPPRAGR